jgi:hypothetical protein
MVFQYVKTYRDCKRRRCGTPKWCETNRIGCETKPADVSPLGTRDRPRPPVPGRLSRPGRAIVPEAGRPEKLVGQMSLSRSVRRPRAARTRRL